MDNMKKESNTRQLRFTNKPLLIMTLIYAVLGAFLILDASFLKKSLDTLTTCINVIIMVIISNNFIL